MKILISGATGFVGKPLCDELFRMGRPVRAAVRLDQKKVDNVENFAIAIIDHETDWKDALLGVSVIIHLAARVHFMKDTEPDPLNAFRNINVEGTLNLARQAVKAGVRRFIFISTIKVNGENTLLGKPFTCFDEPAPVDPYAISKREAEDGLRNIAKETGMEVVIIRPTLIYGPGVKANFHSMLSWLNKGIPLPFGAIDNKRSLVALGNLLDLIITCIDHPAAANQTFLVSDGEDMSTTELLERMAAALGKRARLLPLPMSLLHKVARLLGKQDLYQRLCQSLQVDMSKTKELLNWSPPISVNEALLKTATDFLAVNLNNSEISSGR
jgi:nucleoside-diphosphate-sugar epimerase